jgi:septum formation protein
MKIILGSKSPRRKELLELLGYEFVIKVSDVDETVQYTTYQEMVQKIAMKKAIAIHKDNINDLIISADTIVICNNQVLGKPKDINEARVMINLLKNKVHEVYTAVVCIHQETTINFLEVTKVWVTEITDEEIEEYIKTNEPYDKAGAYGIQGIFAKYIEKIDGDYYNVMGLPICRLNKELKKIKIL